MYFYLFGDMPYYDFIYAAVCLTSHFYRGTFSMTTKYKVIIVFSLMVCLLAAAAALGYIKLRQASTGFAAYRVEARIYACVR